MTVSIDRLDLELKSIAGAKVEGAASATMRPVDAATLIILDRSAPEPKVLMGRRNASVKFMPNKFVFPGGRVDPSDNGMPVAGILQSHVEQRLIAGKPPISASRARALALAATREAFEETGIMIGTRDHGAPEDVPAGSWSAFKTHGVYPDLEGFQYLARAITPPGRTRRFDTRFFVVDSSFIAHRIEIEATIDDELTEIDWIGLKDAKALEIPMITLVILEELDARLNLGLESKAPVPCFKQRYGRFVREDV